MPAKAPTVNAKYMEPGKEDSERTCKAAAVKAPIPIRPSRAMFTTPERSHTMPPAAVIKMGETTINVEGTSPRIMSIIFPPV